jgi:tRNA A-37 threonylcarbamoyl transferase component Bud32
VKWFDDRGALRRALRGSRARRAWRNAFRLQMADVATPAAPLLLEERSLARRPQSVLVTEFLDGATMLHRHVAQAGLEAAAPALAATARLVARLHDEGLSQRDLKAENVLVAADGSIALVDLDGIARRDLDLPRIARDLARLNASFRDRGPAMTRVRCDFLATYRAARCRLRPPHEALARAIVHLTERKWQEATTAPR